MVAYTKERGRGNPGFGSTLSRRGYFSRTHSTSAQLEDSELRYDARTSRNKEGKWKTPDEITQDAHDQWLKNNDKVKTALSNSSASQSTPWGTFTAPSQTRNERDNIMRVHFQNVKARTQSVCCRSCPMWASLVHFRTHQSRIQLQGCISGQNAWSLESLQTVSVNM